MYRCAHCENKHTFAYEAKQCAGQAAHRRMTAAPPPPPEPVIVTRQVAPDLEKKMEFLGQLAVDLANGMYAVSLNEDDNLLFFRVSRPKKGRLQGAIKIQTQHSDLLKDAFVIWPSGRWSQYQIHRTRLLVDHLAILMVNATKAGVAYGRKIGRCCRCNKALTDPRSRHYGIGPECEQFWPHIIAEVDELVAAGEL